MSQPRLLLYPSHTPPHHQTGPPSELSLPAAQKKQTNLNVLKTKELIAYFKRHRKVHSPVIRNGVQVPGTHISVSLTWTHNTSILVFYCSSLESMLSYGLGIQ